MKYLSMFSGIEAASSAWHSLGWTAAAFCEIDPFASAVLATRYPDVPNLGNVEEANFDAIGPIDAAVFGSPCQSFSVAGKRLGLDDPRGNLALIAGKVVYRKRPRWFVFENVPGLLSSDGGWDFGTLLAVFAGHPTGSVFQPPETGWDNSGIVEQAEGGYGLAWRVLDAQYIRVDTHPRAVPQRRRRVFVVGYLGDWRRAAAVLFERQSLSGNPAPRREAGKGTAPTLAARTRGGGGLGTGFDCDGGLIAFGGNDTRGPIDVATAQTAHGGSGRFDFESETFVAQALRADGFDASEDGTGRGTPIVPIAFSAKDHGADAMNDCSPTLRAGGFDKSHANAGVMPAIAYSLRSDAGRDGSAKTPSPDAEGRVRLRDPGFNVYEELAPTLDANAPHTVAAGPTVAFHARQDPDSGPVTHPLDTDGTSIGILHQWRVRRLTPRECERLQGFPDDYTLIPYGRKVRAEKLDADFLKYQLRGNPKHLTREDLDRLAADGPRYKALGNSFAVPVMRWIGQRIKLVDAL